MSIFPPRAVTTPNQSGHPAHFFCPEKKWGFLAREFRAPTYRTLFTITRVLSGQTALRGLGVALRPALSPRVLPIFAKAALDNLGEIFALASLPMARRVLLRVNLAWSMGNNISWPSRPGALPPTCMHSADAVSVIFIYYVRGVMEVSLLVANHVV